MLLVLKRCKIGSSEWRGLGMWKLKQQSILLHFQSQWE